MPRHRTGRRTAGTWGEFFAKTKMCKFIRTGVCIRGQACGFAHDAEELRPLPNLHCTKMCRSFASTGVCDKPDSCTFAHSEEEVQFHPAISARPRPKELDAEAEFAMAEVAKKAISQDSADSQDIWSRQTTAETSAEAFSESSPHSPWSEEATEDWTCLPSDNSEFEAPWASKTQGFPAWQSITSLAACNAASDPWDSDDDDDLQLQVHNTFLAALPRRHSNLRASSLPASLRSLTKSMQSSSFVSY
eukprot:CAMPEP_0170595768 /NCGR_PEP_ID=MMETSP0224-20130122/14741_1 /TAXON_ID=285029 /ORGANISM="Togula jolla, Strain CCCM 725" /LENGTH=246 /DNA_ID=CAMNT_0010919977 /DNA_START=84 /DNA_END=824 /DNA_ORIENTATION=+